MSWPILQKDISAWAAANFGDSPAWQSLLGIVEEVGEFYAELANLNNPPDPDVLRDALGDGCIYALSLCERVGLSFDRDVATQDNGPDDLSDRELLGALALASHAILKHSQGIRRMDWDKRREHVRIAIGLWFRWAQAQVVKRRIGISSAGIVPGWLLLPIVEITWKQVQLRNWKDRPDDANLVASEKQVAP